MKRLTRILSDRPMGGHPIAADSPQSPCTLCGGGTTHGDSIVADTAREHFACREQIRSAQLSSMVLERDCLRVAEALAKEGVLFKRLESRLLPYVARPSAEMLCRMITLCLAELAVDPSIPATRKQDLSTRLCEVRRCYLPSTN